MTSNCKIGVSLLSALMLWTGAAHAQRTLYQPPIWQIDVLTTPQRGTNPIVQCFREGGFSYYKSTTEPSSARAIHTTAEPCVTSSRAAAEFLLGVDSARFQNARLITDTVTIRTYVWERPGFPANFGSHFVTEIGQTLYWTEMQDRQTYSDGDSVSNVFTVLSQTEAETGRSSLTPPWRGGSGRNGFTAWAERNMNNRAEEFAQRDAWQVTNPYANLSDYEIALMGDRSGVTLTAMRGRIAAINPPPSYALIHGNNLNLTDAASIESALNTNTNRLMLKLTAAQMADMAQQIQRVWTQRGAVADYAVTVTDNPRGVLVSGSGDVLNVTFALDAAALDLTDTEAIKENLSHRPLLLDEAELEALAQRIRDVWSGYEVAARQKVENALAEQLGDDIDYGLKLETTLPSNDVLAINLTSGGFEYARPFQFGKRFRLTPRAVTGGWFGGDAHYIGGGLAADFRLDVAAVMLGLGIDTGSFFVFFNGTATADGFTYDDLRGFGNSDPSFFADAAMNFSDWKVNAQLDTRAVLQLGATFGGFSLNLNSEGGGHFGYKFNF